MYQVNLFPKKKKNSWEILNNCFMEELCSLYFSSSFWGFHPLHPIWLSQSSTSYPSISLFFFHILVLQLSPHSYTLYDQAISMYLFHAGHSLLYSPHYFNIIKWTEVHCYARPSLLLMDSHFLEQNTLLSIKSLKKLKFSILIQHHLHTKMQCSHSILLFINLWSNQESHAHVKLMAIVFNSNAGFPQRFL